ncbi:hypothetical protein LWC34_03440 [Kibdelosporangium philippinense]|uniref:GerMN domain-containing protein n=1 Tax=Kibdelosporangium philippinense TaxID=211113 RepID=A0ABS8Z1S8_9PSEU|nr:hypothetical protein [Kibdelosporangium philippinense]MCE7001894.1 hypothetical protein [Kibdelosporangium philippinense]
MKRALLALALIVAGCGVQPSSPIPGSHATGALIYLVRTYDGTLAPILQPARFDTKIEAALDILTNTQIEPAVGYRNEVPRNAGPMTVTGSTVRLPIDVSTLSTLAAQQIVCTAAISGPATLVGGGQTRGRISCPV